MLILCSYKYCSSVFVQKEIEKETEILVEHGNWVLGTYWTHSETWRNYLLLACPWLTCCWCLDGVSLMRPGYTVYSLDSLINWVCAVTWELTLNHWMMITELREWLLAAQIARRPALIRTVTSSQDDHQVEGGNFHSFLPKGSGLISVELPNNSCCGCCCCGYSTIAIFLFLSQIHYKRAFFTLLFPGSLLYRNYRTFPIAYLQNL